MKKVIQVIAIGSIAAMVAQSGFADVMAYPEKGQSSKQQQKDKYECFEWAKGQTGFDPTAQQQAGTAATPPPKGGAARGAGKGAAVGALGGAIGGDAGKGAAIGAGVGAVGGGVKRRRSEKQATQEQSQVDAQQNQKRTAFNKAQGVCLTGKGYSVG
jgi:hypothetical protein